MQGGMKDRVKEGGVLVIYLYICKIVKKIIKKKKKKHANDDILVLLRENTQVVTSLDASR